MKDEEIDYSDIPELEEDFWKNAVLWQGNKVQLTLGLDPDVLAFFKKQGRGYKTNINSVLRRYVEAQKGILRRRAASPIKASRRK